jgi:dTDP-4-dehydrorhamnose 3,5-epimerase
VKFETTTLKDAVLIHLDPRQDERGFFARTYCQKEFAAAGLETGFVQGNMSVNPARGTLRGMHFQKAPHEEVKVVRCISGAIYDVIVDLRPASPSYLKWQGFELTAENGLQLYVPRGFAHGFLTLCDQAAVVYQVSAFYAPGAEGGLRWNDPRFGIEWPADVAVLSPKDAAWPDFSPQPSPEFREADT